MQCFHLQVAERPYTHRIKAPQHGGEANPAASTAADGPAADAAGGGAAGEGEAADGAGPPPAESLVRCRFVLERLPGQAAVPRTQDGRCLKVFTVGS